MVSEATVDAVDGRKRSPLHPEAQALRGMGKVDQLHGAEHPAELNKPALCEVRPPRSSLRERHGDLPGKRGEASMRLPRKRKVPDQRAPTPVAAHEDRPPALS